MQHWEQGTMVMRWWKHSGERSVGEGEGPFLIEGDDNGCCRSRGRTRKCCPFPEPMLTMLLLSTDERKYVTNPSPSSDPPSACTSNDPLSLHSLLVRKASHQGEHHMREGRDAEVEQGADDERCRRTLCAVVVAAGPSTSSTRAAPAVDTPQPSSVLVRHDWKERECEGWKADAIDGADEWGQKAKRRHTTGTGRMAYLKDVSRRFKNGCVAPLVADTPSRRTDLFFLSSFREGTVATRKVKASAE